MSSPKRPVIVVYLLVALFGVASWIDINGLWVELPILVQELPEGWNLPSYIVVITQLANIGPLLYGLVCSGRLQEKSAIFFIISIGAATCLVLVFFWQQTVFLVGAQRSVPLFIMNFILACVDCTSTVVFFPFMATFKPAYMSAYFTGEGLGGLLPGLLGLAQGAGRVVCLNETVYKNVTINGTVSNNVTSGETVFNNITSDGSTFLEVSFVIKESYEDNLFSFEVFFSIISAIIVISGISFTVLVFHPVCKKEQVKHTEIKYSNENSSVEQIPKVHTSEQSANSPKHFSNTEVKTDSPCVKTTGETQNEIITSVTKMSRTQYVISLLATGWVNCLRNSVLLSVQPYSCLPYGTTQYHLAVTLSNVAAPLACFFNLFCITTSIPALSLMSVVSSLLGAYIMVAAAMSPTPVLVGTIVGSALIVAVWVLCVFLLSYVKVSLASLFRTEGKKSLLHCGVATQVGSAVGGASMFVLVNVLNIFESTNACS